MITIDQAQVAGTRCAVAALRLGRQMRTIDAVQAATDWLTTHGVAPQRSHYRLSLTDAFVTAYNAQIRLATAGTLILPRTPTEVW